MPWNPDEYMEPNTMISKKSKEMLAEIQEDKKQKILTMKKRALEAEGAESKDQGDGKEEKDKTETSSVPMGEQEDTGAGVSVDEDVTLPKFKEDIEQEEHKRKLEELKAKKKALAEAAAALGAQGVNLSELPIDFPTTWAFLTLSKEEITFSKDKKYSIKELEHFLETSPFEVYKLSKGATKGGLLCCPKDIESRVI